MRGEVTECNMIAFCHTRLSEISVCLILPDGASHRRYVGTFVERRLEHVKSRAVVCAGGNRSCRHDVKRRECLSQSNARAGRRRQAESTSFRGKSRRTM